MVEEMDRENADPVLLQNTYRQFEKINGLLSQWKSIYKKEIKPHLNKSCPNTLLDIGFGGGDVPINIHRWAKRDGFDLQITAIEIDERAYQYANQLGAPEEISFNFQSSRELVEKNLSFDFVISNHVLHHLNEKQFYEMLDDAKLLATKKIVFNDIKRSYLGYSLFNICSRILFSDSYITKDGLTSIKRSYTQKELCDSAPPDWKVKSKFPFRLLLIYDKT